MKNLLIAVVLIVFSLRLNAQTVLLEEGFYNGIPETWSVVDADGQTPDSSISFINEAWVAYESVFDTCAISTSYYAGSSNQSMDYLISPKLNLLSFGHILSWESKSFDANYLESYYVLLSTTDSLPESFSDTLMMVSEDSPFWKTHSVNLFLGGFADQPVYIAFRNASTNEFILGIDNVKLTTNDVASISAASDNPVEVYPTPVLNTLNINLPSGSAYSIYNAHGEPVSQGLLENAKIDVADLPSGVYFLEYKKGSHFRTKKIIKL